MIILHGENTVQSRHKLVELLDHAKNTQHDIIRLDAAKLTEAELETNLGSQQLFGTPKVVVIDELHSLPKSGRKDALIAQISRLATHTTDDTTQLILWEKRSLTAPMIKKCGPATVTEFKVSNTLFKWLESLSPNPKTKATQLKLFHQTLETDDEFMCLAMLIRQIRLLIQAKDGGKLKGAPFMIAKLTKQAEQFTQPQLLHTHRSLLELELAHKTSKTIFSLSQDLDLLLVHL